MKNARFSNGDQLIWNVRTGQPLIVTADDNTCLLTPHHLNTIVSRVPITLLVHVAGVDISLPIPQRIVRVQHLLSRLRQFYQVASVPDDFIREAMVLDSNFTGVSFKQMRKSISHYADFDPDHVYLERFTLVKRRKNMPIYLVEFGS